MAVDEVGDGGLGPGIYEKTAPRIRGLCRLLLGSSQEAEDATSEVFLRAQRALASYDHRLPLLGWIFGIARHYCVDLLRHRSLERRLFVEADTEYLASAEPTLLPLAALLAAEEQARVRAAVTRLPDRYRLPLVLRYYEDLGYDEIAATLGLSRQGVANHLFRAKQELRRSLAGDDEGGAL
jgi:RNA polymerase sigma-70 factor (ECF subfamily)